MAEALPPAPGSSGREAEVGERIEAIELALRLRPGVDLAGLRDTLKDLGHDVDLADVKADLASLDLDPVEEPVQAAPARTGPLRNRPSLGPAVTSLVTRHGRWGVAGAAVVGLVLAGATVVGGRPGSAVDSTLEQELRELAVGGPSTPGQRVAPQGPGQDPQLADGADIVARFDQDQEGLAPPSATTEWVIDSGTWATRSGQVAAAADGRALAHLDAPAPDIRAEVALPEAVPGAGLAFRIDDADSFLAWVLSPEYATVLLYRVVDGAAEVVTDSGITTLEPGVRLGVAIEGSTVTLLANGTEVATTTDDGSATGIGLVSLDGTAPATFDELTVRFGP